MLSFYQSSLWALSLSSCLMLELAHASGRLEFVGTVKAPSCQLEHHHDQRMFKQSNCRTSPMYVVKMLDLRSAREQPLTVQWHAQEQSYHWHYHRRSQRCAYAVVN